MRRIRPLLPSVLAVPLLLSACAATPGSADSAAKSAAAPSEIVGYRVIGDGRACAFAGDVTDWRAVDRDHLVVDTFRKSYLIRVGGVCAADPSEKLSIGIGSSAGSVCPGDPLIIGGDRCAIRAMWEIPDRKPIAAKPTG